MVSTRANSQQQEATGTPRPKKTAKNARLLKELEIDGLDALRGGVLKKRVVDPKNVVKADKGETYEIENDGAWKVEERTGGRKRRCPNEEENEEEEEEDDDDDNYDDEDDEDENGEARTRARKRRRLNEEKDEEDEDEDEDENGDNDRDEDGDDDPDEEENKEKDDEEDKENEGENHVRNEESAPGRPQRTRRPTAKAVERERAEAAAERQTAAALKRAGRRWREFDEIRERDAEYLAETLQLLQNTKMPKHSAGQQLIKKMLPFLRKLEPVSIERVERNIPYSEAPDENTPDAYFLDDGMAKTFFKSTAHITAPVFLTNQTIPILDSKSKVRPIEQIFPWLDMAEPHWTRDLERDVRQEDRETDLRVTVAGMRERFVDDPQDQLFPWNFPEICLPTVTETMPGFLRHPHCNLLRDILRYAQSINTDDICPATCEQHGATAENCKQHLVTPAEIVELNNSYRSWLGTVMISEAGGMTEPHSDTFGFGTYICCGEGEIGIGWTPEVTARRREISKNDRWLFKVLRPGDAVYIDPGRYHLVFRQPGGEHTFGWSPRLLRYYDIDRWLTIINLELARAIDGEWETGTELVWRSLVFSARHLVDKAVNYGTVEKYGGDDKIRVASELLDRAERWLKKLFPAEQN